MGSYWTDLMESRIGRRGVLRAAAMAGAASAIIACSGNSSQDQNPSPAAVDDRARPPGWTVATHSDQAAPNYAVVFPRDRVNDILIRVDASDWQAMEADMTAIMGPRGTGQFRGGQPGQPGQPGQQGGLGLRTKPMWVPGTIEFQDQKWTSVGVRYKGNSSLRSAWSSGSAKMPLKLDFDEFEDEVPEVKNQRFFGFKQLSLANGFGDQSYMRERTAYDLLDTAGHISPRTAHYRVTVDYGQGPVLLGVYVTIEVIDDTVIPRYFSDATGNIYEADGGGANLALATANQIESSFLKENNQNTDWSDIRSWHSVLHSQQRLASPAAWRNSMERVFDVRTFLEWLGISAVLQHWDTYGAMSHNYYIYNDPKEQRLNWISWDHNLVLGASGMAGGGQNAAPAGPAGGGGPNRNVTFDKREVNANWPLIRYLLDDPIYYALYLDLLRKTAEQLFDPDRLASSYDAMARIIGSAVSAEIGGSAFENAVRSLKGITAQRSRAALDFLLTAS